MRKEYLKYFALYFAIFVGAKMIEQLGDDRWIYEYFGVLIVVGLIVAIRRGR